MGKGVYVPAGDYQLGNVVNGVASDLVDVDEFATTYPIPVIELNGDFDTMTKDIKNVVSFRMLSADGKTITDSFSQTKWQGSSSIAYPKKNYTLKLYDDMDKKSKKKLQFGDWYATNKFILKANYIDPTHSRNIVNARLWRKIVKETGMNGVEFSKSKAAYPRFLNSPMQGSVDGFPVHVRINGKEQGLYTLNLDNNDELFGITKDDKNAVLFYSKVDSPATRFYDNSTLKLDGTDFSLDYPDEVTPEALATVKALIGETGMLGDQYIGNADGFHLHLQNFIDYQLFVNALNDYDSGINNTGYVSYDGDYLFVTAYDMDSTWGLAEDGQGLKSLEGWVNGTSLTNALFKKYPDKVYARWHELRADLLKEENILQMFDDFRKSVGDYEYQVDADIWADIPSRKFASYDQIESAVPTRLKWVDSYIETNFKPKTT